MAVDIVYITVPFGMTLFYLTICDFVRFAGRVGSDYHTSFIVRLLALINI